MPSASPLGPVPRACERGDSATVGSFHALRSSAKCIEEIGRMGASDGRIGASPRQPGSATVLVTERWTGAGTCGDASSPE